MKWDVTGTESLKREMTITGLPVARPAQINELYWMVSRAAKTLYVVWTVFWQARRARKLQVYTIPRHSCSPLNSIGRSSNCWVLFYCWYVRSISFSQNSLLRALRESSPLQNHRIPVQVWKWKGESSENRDSESGQWGPPLTTTVEPLARPPLVSDLFFWNYTYIVTLKLHVVTYLP